MLQYQYQFNQINDRALVGAAGAGKRLPLFWPYQQNTTINPEPLTKILTQTNFTGKAQKRDVKVALSNTLL